MNKELIKSFRVNKVLLKSVSKGIILKCNTYGKDLENPNFRFWGTDFEEEEAGTNNMCVDY